MPNVWWLSHKCTYISWTMQFICAFVILGSLSFEWLANTKLFLCAYIMWMAVWLAAMEKFAAWVYVRLRYNEGQSAWRRYVSRLENARGTLERVLDLTPIESNECEAQCIIHTTTVEIRCDEDIKVKYNYLITYIVFGINFSCQHPI